MQLKDLISDPSPRDLRVFAGLQVLFFAILSQTILRPHLNIKTQTLLLLISSVAGVLGLISPQLIKPIYKLWMLLVFPIGWTVSHLSMAVVYYLIVTPIGIYRRHVHGDPMQREFDPNAESYWEPKVKKRKPEDYFRQF